MKLRNKKTGEIVECLAKISFVEKSYNGLSAGKCRCFDSIDLLNEEWEDYEEPKSGYIIDLMEEDCICDAKFGVDLKDIERAKELGIWFETKEEAEKAVEKLKAWKRLKDTITRIDRASFDDVGTATLFIRYKGKDHKKVSEELDLLFGGEE